MLEIILNEIDECNATGIWWIYLFLRFSMVYCKSVVSFHSRSLYHRIKGDHDAWLDYLEAEDNKRG